jgi:sugar/nucleoside kinase (ribokinase family)
MKKIVGLGACVVDTLISCAAFPTEDKKQPASSIKKAPGGPVCNALVIASRLGASTQVIGAFADDEGGKFILSDLERNGVNTENAVTVQGTESFASYIILSEISGSRTCLFDRGSVPDDPENVNLSSLDDAAVLHLDGNYLRSAIYAAKRAKELGIKVSLDAGGVYPRIEELLPLVDILIPSAEFAMTLTGAPTARGAIEILYERYDPEVLAVTDGERGGYFIDGGAVRTYDAFNITPIDTNAAGDTFHGAFVSHYIEGKSVAECCEFASAVSAYKCIHHGIRDFALDKNIIFDFIKNNDRG